MGMMATNAIVVENLSFGYESGPRCFSNFNLTIPSGSRFGIFGPNGAGKTTLMHLMTGVLPFHEGRISINDIDLGNHAREVKRQIGFVPQELALYMELSPMENLDFFGVCCGLDRKLTKERSEKLLNILGLLDVKDRPVRTFSGGMKRRVNLAAGVIHEPRVLFLDEPTVGVDVQTRHAIIAYLKDLNARGTTLIYTSHQLAEAEDLCEQVAMIDKGELIHTGGASGLEELFLSKTGRDYRD
jgi:ABC-2 type transport system ATP-binding protein